MAIEPSIVTTEWLAERLFDPSIRVADASWYLPQAARDPRAEYVAAHIPGAVFFDLDVLSEPATRLPHMLPRPDLFANDMRTLGIGNDDFVVLYDGSGVYSAPRALWMLRAMGHDACAVLDGGLPKWRREGRRVTSTPAAHRMVSFEPGPRPHLIRSFDEMLANLKSGAEQVLDARSSARFRGEEPEPRSGVRSGHIPGSINVHYADVVMEDGTLAVAEDLRALFAARGVNLARPCVTSCGSGVTAAILTLALERAGVRVSALYDGSWADWGARADAPVETGAGPES